MFSQPKFEFSQEYSAVITELINLRRFMVREWQYSSRAVGYRAEQFQQWAAILDNENDLSDLAKEVTRYFRADTMHILEYVEAMLVIIAKLNSVSRESNDVAALSLVLRELGWDFLDKGHHLSPERVPQNPTSYDLVQVLGGANVPVEPTMVTSLIGRGHYPWLVMDMQHSLSHRPDLRAIIYCLKLGSEITIKLEELFKSHSDTRVSYFFKDDLGNPSSEPYYLWRKRVGEVFYYLGYYIQLQQVIKGLVSEAYGEDADQAELNWRALMSIWFVPSIGKDQKRLLREATVTGESVDIDWPEEIVLRRELFELLAQGELEISTELIKKLAAWADDQSPYKARAQNWVRQVFGESTEKGMSVQGRFAKPPVVEGAKEVEPQEAFESQPEPDADDGYGYRQLPVIEVSESDEVSTATTVEDNYTRTVDSWNQAIRLSYQQIETVPGSYSMPILHQYRKPSYPSQLIIRGRVIAFLSRTPVPLDHAGTSLFSAQKLITVNALAEFNVLRHLFITELHKQGITDKFIFDKVEGIFYYIAQVFATIENYSRGHNLSNGYLNWLEPELDAVQPELGGTKWGLAHNFSNSYVIGSGMAVTQGVQFFAEKEGDISALDLLIDKLLYPAYVMNLEIQRYTVNTQGFNYSLNLWSVFQRMQLELALLLKIKRTPEKEEDFSSMSNLMSYCSNAYEHGLRLATPWKWDQSVKEFSYGAREKTASYGLSGFSNWLEGWKEILVAEISRIGRKRPVVFYNYSPITSYGRPLYELQLSLQKLSKLLLSHSVEPSSVSAIDSAVLELKKQFRVEDLQAYSRIRYLPDDLFDKQSKTKVIAFDQQGQHVDLGEEGSIYWKAAADLATTLIKEEDLLFKLFSRPLLTRLILEELLVNPSSLTKFDRLDQLET